MFASGFERNALAFIFLLLNHLSHDTHFSTRQNMETFQLPQKNQIFLFFSSLIFDSKHGFPENYSDFFLKSQQLRCWDFLEVASELARFGSGTIFLLLNDLSHDSHFSTCQNMETFQWPQKNSNFSLHRFSRYLTPNMAFQTIILTFLVFSFFSSSRMRAMRFPSHNFPKILSNRNEFLQTCSQVNIVVPDTFWAIPVQGFRG